MEILEPYRARIDSIDAQIIELLRLRYQVIAEVGALKAERGIPAIIPERVEQVRAQAGALAAKAGLDAPFIESLYARIIDHSCAVEDRIIAASGRGA